MTGDPVRGRHVMQQYGCVTCHEIPGIVGASAPVGPPLDRMATHSFIGGVLDVMDSLLFAGPVAYGYWLALIASIGIFVSGGSRAVESGGGARRKPPATF